MTYQQILREQFEKRISVNPRYSLRAFARFLNMPASKLSEILNLKKGISTEKAIALSEKLDLSKSMLEIFQTSAAAQHSRSNLERIKAQEKLNDLLREKKTKKSSQRNAWYFGAVSTLLSAGISDDKKIMQALGITKLQVENAKRYVKRMKRLHPDVTEFTYEPQSINKKIQALHFSKDDLINTETEFLLLTATELKTLNESVKKLTHKRKLTSAVKNKQLYLTQFKTIQLTEGEELC